MIIGRPYQNFLDGHWKIVLWKIAIKCRLSSNIMSLNRDCTVALKKYDWPHFIYLLIYMVKNGKGNLNLKPGFSFLLTVLKGG